MGRELAMTMVFSLANSLIIRKVSKGSRPMITCARLGGIRGPVFFYFLKYGGDSSPALPAGSTQKVSPMVIMNPFLTAALPIIWDARTFPWPPTAGNNEVHGVHRIPMIDSRLHYAFSSLRIAPCGQMSAQMPHPTQITSSICAFPSVSFHINPGHLKIRVQ